MNIIKEFNEYIKESDENLIRVSCASFARIKVGDKYMLILNGNAIMKGNKIYGPIGGGLEFLESGREFLTSINASPEKSNYDLRIRLPKENLEEFKKWFYSKADRENGVFREVQEELVDEMQILKSISESDVTESYVKTSEDEAVSQKIGFEGTFTKYIFEIYEVTFSEKVQKELLEACNEKIQIVGLFTEEEILNLPNIGGQTKHLI